MKLIHLELLARAYRTPLDIRGPLVIPWWFTQTERESTILYFHGLIDRGTLRRMDVYWQDDGVSEKDRRLLGRARRAFGSQGVLLVVHVESSRLMVREVLGEATVGAFEYVAIACDHPTGDEPLAMLSALASHAERQAEDAYRELVEDFGVEVLLSEVEDVMAAILTPEDKVVLLDSLLWAQLDEDWDLGNARDFGGIFASLKAEALAPETLVLLLGIAFHRVDAAAALLGEEPFARAQRSARQRMLLRDGELSGWARWLRHPAFADALDPSAEQLDGPWGPAVQTAIMWIEGRTWAYEAESTS